MLALAHLHRHLAEREAMLDRHHHPLDLGVVVGIVGGEQVERRAVQRLKAGGRVGDPLARDRRDDKGEQPDADAARGRRAVALAAGEA